jgi:hypothetical protein
MLLSCPMENSPQSLEYHVEQCQSIYRKNLHKKQV